MKKNSKYCNFSVSTALFKESTTQLIFGNVDQAAGYSFFLILCRIYMNHDVLCISKLPFLHYHVPSSAIACASFKESVPSTAISASIYTLLPNILVLKRSRRTTPFRLPDVICNFFFVFFTAGCIQHLIQRIFENIKCYFQDKNTDNLHLPADPAQEIQALHHLYQSVNQRKKMHPICDAMHLP